MSNNEREASKKGPTATGHAAVFPRGGMNYIGQKSNAPPSLAFHLVQRTGDERRRGSKWPFGAFFDSFFLPLFFLPPVTLFL